MMKNKIPSTENIRAKLGLANEDNHDSKKMFHPWDNTNAFFENTTNSDWLQKQFLRTIDSENTSKNGLSMLQKTKQMHLEGINSKK